MMPKVPIAYYDEVYWTTGTRSNYGPYPGPDWWVHHAIAAMLAACYQFPFDGRALDVGGAFGYHAGALAERTGVHAFVVDASKYAVEHADARVTAVWLDAGAQPLPFPSSSMDLVMSIETLEHVYEPEIPFVLREIARVLKPGAPLYASIAITDPARRPACPSRRAATVCPDLSHQTMKPRAWWHEHLTESDLVRDEEAQTRLQRFRCKARALIAYMGWEVFPYRRTAYTEARLEGRRLA
jgi:SAM-dependent methyltransferase